MEQLTFRLPGGALLKEEIEKRTAHIKAGVLLSIVGALKNAELRMAGATPDKQVVKHFDGPLEIVSGTGTFSSDGCHIHLSVSDREGRVFGGHLKGGCVVDLTAEIVIGVFPEATFQRTHDDTTGFPELLVG